MLVLLQTIPIGPCVNITSPIHIMAAWMIKMPACKWSNHTDINPVRTGNIHIGIGQCIISMQQNTGNINKVNGFDTVSRLTWMGENVMIIVKTVFYIDIPLQMHIKLRPFRYNSYRFISICYRNYYRYHAHFSFNLSLSFICRSHLSLLSFLRT